VMVIATRDGITPNASGVDSRTQSRVRDGAGSVYVENNQEILDTIIMAYKIERGPGGSPTCQCLLRWFYLSHMSEPLKFLTGVSWTNFSSPL
jgi:hypothetical protein